MSWVLHSRDFNPIERLWDVVGQRLRTHNPPIRNLCELPDLSLSIYHALPDYIYQKFVESMPMSTEAVVQDTGGQIRF